MKRFTTPLLLFLFAWIFVVIISEIFFPDVVEKQGGLFLFASIAAAAVLAFVRELILYFGEAKKLESERMPDSDPNDDSKITNIPWDALDNILVRKYFELCPEEEKPKSNKELPKYFISKGLARKFNSDLYLTQAGVLLFCDKKNFPHTLYHTDVNIKIYDGRDYSQNFSGSVLELFFNIRDRLSQYWQPLNAPSIRDAQGRETIIIYYPEVALLEAMINFLIHRNYKNDDIATITILEDRIEFENPGKSIYPIEQMMNVEIPIRPLYKRNQRLIQAFNKTGLNQREGGGILRIRKSLIDKDISNNEDIVDADGNKRLIIKNDDESDRFKLVIYRKQFPDTSFVDVEDSSEKVNPVKEEGYFEKLIQQLSGQLGQATKGTWERMTRGSGEKPSAYLTTMTDMYRQTLGEKVEIYGKTETPIGRNPMTNKIVIQDNREQPEVSKEHAVIWYEASDKLWYIKDMSSTNGTRVNSVPLKELEEEVLENGAEIILGRLAYGGVKFTFNVVPNDDISITEDKDRIVH